MVLRPPISLAQTVGPSKKTYIRRNGRLGLVECFLTACFVSGTSTAFARTNTDHHHDRTSLRVWRYIGFLLLWTHLYITPFYRQHRFKPDDEWRVAAGNIWVAVYLYRCYSLGICYSYPKVPCMMCVFFRWCDVRLPFSINTRFDN